MKLRWLKEVDLQSRYVAEAKSGSVRIWDDGGTLVARAEVAVRKAPVAAAVAVRPPRLPEWERDFAAALAVYRGQRAWRVMLAVRKIYDVLTRGSWGKRVGLLLPGGLSGLDEYELEFPRVEKYVGDETEK